MGGKNFIQKLKTGIAGLSLMSFLYFNSATAQENYIPKYNTIAHKMLMIEDSADNIPFNTYPTLRTLDNLIDNAKNYIEKKENYTKQEIAEISKKIYGDILKQIPSIKERKDEDLCYRNSLIYLAIGQANNIPLYGTITQGAPQQDHIFIRYDPDGKHDPLNSNNSINKKDINIETTTGEIQENQKGIFSDKYYINTKAISKQTLENGISLKNLNEKELLSITYLQRGRLYNIEGRKAEIERNETHKQSKYSEMIKMNKKAFNDYNKALELNPNNLRAYIALGDFLGESPGIYEPKDPEFSKYNPLMQSIENLNKTIELDSLNPKAYELLGRTYLRSYKWEKSIESYTKALDLIEKKLRNKKSSQEIVYQLSWEISYPLMNLKIDCFSGRSCSYFSLGNKENAERDTKEVKKLIPIQSISEKKLKEIIIKNAGK